MIHFALEEKLAIVAACTAVIALLAIIMACKLSPACFLYKFCPLRATYDDDIEEMTMKIGGNNHKYKTRYKMIDYKTLLPVVPSIKVTTLDETNSVSCDVTKPASFCLAPGSEEDSYSPSRSPGSHFHLSRPPRRSKGSISGSSTGSSERISPSRSRLFPRLRRSGSGTLSSDGDDTVSVSTPASLEVGLQYNETQEKLTVFLYRARRIPPNVYGGANDSFVQVIIGKDTSRYWRRKSEVPVDDLLRQRPGSPRNFATGDQPIDEGYSKLAEFQTRIVRKDTEPVFKERFAVNDVKVKEKKNVWIKFILHSIDRFSHQHIVGTRQIGLDRAASAEADMEREKFSIVLDQYTPNLGDMTLSLCYMPTAGRLVVTVSKIANLKPPDGLEIANPYVKAAIVRRGKVLEKHVTSPQLRAINPSFDDDPLVFDVPNSELEKVVLLITVIHDDAVNVFDDQQTHRGFIRRRSFGDVDSAFESGSPLQKSRSNNCMPTMTCTPLGRIAFGSSAVVDIAARRQWAEMIRHPRKQIIQTHKLKP